MKAAALILALIVGSPAVAAPKIVTKQAQLTDLGACLVRLAPDRSTALLRTPIATVEERNAAQLLLNANRGCVRGAVLSGRTGAVRGAVAEAVLMREPALLDAFAARPDAAPKRPPVADGRAFVIAYSACLTGARPKQTVAFLRTPIQTPEERTAFQGYGDTLMACMPEGLRYTIDITDVRNHVAALTYARATNRAGA